MGCSVRTDTECSLGNHITGAAGGPMYQTVIAPFDGSRFAAQAIVTAAEIARRCGAHLVLARVHQAYVYEDMDYSISEEDTRRDEEEYLADIAEFVDETYGVQAERRLLSGAVVPAL